MTHKKISRRQLLRGLAALGAATMMGCSPRTPWDDEPGEKQEKQDDVPTPLPMPTPTTVPTPPGTGWNFIVVVLDSLRCDHVGFYNDGSALAQTPHIDAFAARSLVFDRAYTGGFPTLLNRAEMFAGRHAFTYMGWENLPDDEVVLANVLNEVGYTTAIIFDTWHLKTEGRTYDRGFGSSNWIRGQEGDRYLSTPSWPPLPAAEEKFRHPANTRQYLRNVSERQGEEDYFVAQTMRTAIEWLREHHDGNRFYLHVDSFDPHEPWDPPQPYVDLYDPGYVGEEVIYPAYAPPDYYMTEEELHHVQALYAAEVTMADRWAGELLAEIDRLKLWDNTVVILMSDHGILLGEHDAVGKSWEYFGHRECYPLYRELVHIPFMVHAPGLAHRRAPDLVQPADIMPTIVEWAGAEDPATMQGVSLVPTIEDAGGSSHTPPRALAMSSRSLHLPLQMKPSCTITDGEWTLVYGGKHGPNKLYYLPDDPAQQVDLLSERCDVARSFHAEWVAFLEKAGTYTEHIAPWRSPPC